MNHVNAERASFYNVLAVWKAQVVADQSPQFSFQVQGSARSHLMSFRVHILAKPNNTEEI